jgi:chemotaxis protein MotB
MSAGDGNIIIIKKIKKGGHAHHGGSWKVAYADFVTAMMALFIVLWVLAQAEKTKKAVALYFTEPNLTPQEIKMRLEHPALPTMKDKMQEIKDAKSKNMIAYDEETKKLKKLAQAIRDKLNALKWFRSMKGQLIIELTDEGLRIEFLENDKSPFFDVGSPVPRDYTREALNVIAAEIAQLPNNVAIEGHTDSRPFQNGKNGYGNWELSTERANAARRIIETGGVHQIAEVRGLADTRLRNTADPMDHANRRVSLIVRYVNSKPPVETVEPTPSVNSTPSPEEHTGPEDEHH